MNITAQELMDKIIRLSMLFRRLEHPHIPHEGPRGRSQERALTQIALRDGLTQKELMERMGIQPSSMSELISKLDAGGLIQRAPLTDDRRQVALHISEKGRRHLEDINNSTGHLQPFEVFSAEEAEELGRLLDRLIESAQKSCAELGLPLYPPRPLPPQGFDEAPDAPRHHPRPPRSCTPQAVPRHLPGRPGFEHPPRRLPNMHTQDVPAPTQLTSDDSDSGPHKI